MKRQYKFRGKAKNTGRWIYGDLVRIPEDGGVGEPPSDKMITYVTDTSIIIHEMIEVEPETLGEWSGITNKQDHNIYEEDIVSIRFSQAGDEYKGVVQFGTVSIGRDDYGYENIVTCWHMVFSDGSGATPITSDFTVLGNIHSNPELLK